MSDYVTKAELLEMFDASTELLLRAVLEVLGVPGAGAARKRRAQEDEGVDPGFVAARREIRKAIANPLVSLGDPGHRINDGIHALPLAKISDSGDGDGEAGPALRAVRARARRRRAD